MDGNLRQGGGQRQRLQRVLPQSQQTSELGRYLLRSWAWGQLSATEVQKIAALAKIDLHHADGRPHADLDYLATLGACGA